MMFLIFLNRVILGVDGFINGPHQIGSQFRLFCFGLNIIVMWGDNDPDGNMIDCHLKLYNINEVL